MKIYLEFIKEPVSGMCVVSKKKVKFKGPCGFFADGKHDKPVSEAEAIKKGFTVTPKTMKRLSLILDLGVKFEEIQRASRQEFESWQALT
jgi:hypothetical protein